MSQGVYENGRERDELLRRARKVLVREYDGEIRASSEDFAGRHGFHVSVADHDFILVAKGRQFEGQVSVSKPALANALRTDEWILLWDREAERFRVFDPEYVSRRGTERYVQSKRADEIGLRDVSPSAGVSLDAFIRNERPATLDPGKQEQL